MPSQRRMRAIVLAAIACVFLLFYYSRHEESDFYERTVNGLDRSREGSGQQIPDAAKIGGMGNPRIDHDDDGSVDEDDEQVAQQMAERLREAEQKAKDLANSKSPNPPDNPEKLVGVGNAAGTGDHDRAEKQDVLAEVEDTPSVQTTEEQVEPETGSGGKALPQDDQEIEDELDSILARAPIIIFSKSYCPHSKKAKDILLRKYDIDPAPHVVELDKHPIGLGIQGRLADMTGRSTVPNVMVNGKSIGGGSEMETLHSNNELIEEIEKWGSVGGGKSSKVTIKHHVG